jgi:hypothetical protein
VNQDSYKIIVGEGEESRRFDARFTVILSFLKRERDRTVNVILQTFQFIVYLVQYDRCLPFTVPDRSPFLTIHGS